MLTPQQIEQISFSRATFGGYDMQSVDEFLEPLTEDYITLYNADEAGLQSLGKAYEKVAEGYRVWVENTAEATSLIVAHPEVFTDYEIVKGKMDDVFLAATGKKLAGGGV